MCQGIEVIGMMLLTCIYDLKTQNPYASFCYALSLFLCYGWTIWLTDLLGMSDPNHENSVLKNLEGYCCLGIGNKQILLVSIKISYFTEHI